MNTSSSGSCLAAFIVVVWHIHGDHAIAGVHIRQIYADETGWRTNGRNGYLWSVSCPNHVRFGDPATADQTPAAFKKAKAIRCGSISKKCRFLGRNRTVRRTARL